MSPDELRAVRIELGLSGAALARRLGIRDRRTVYRWQSGTQAVPAHIAALVRLLLWLHRVGIDDPFADGFG